MRRKSSSGVDSTGVGDENGKVGVGVAKADDVVNAFKKAKTDVTQIKNEQYKDPVIPNKIKGTIQNPTKYPFMFKDGLLYKLESMSNNSIKKRKLIYLPSSMMNLILKFYQNDPLSGHFGIRHAYLKLRQVLVAKYETVNYSTHTVLFTSSKI